MRLGIERGGAGEWVVAGHVAERRARMGRTSCWEEANDFVCLLPSVCLFVSVFLSVFLSLSHSHSPTCEHTLSLPLSLSHTHTDYLLGVTIHQYITAHNQMKK